MSASMRAQPPLYCFQVEDDSVPIAVQERMESHAGRLWNDFYDTHRAKFFKDRHWLGREWPQLALAGGGEGQGSNGVGVVEVGCGVGNAALPLLEVVAAPAPVYACDFSATAIEILRRAAASSSVPGGGGEEEEEEEGGSSNKNNSSRLRAFVADAATPGELLRASRGHGFPPIEPHSLAAATLVFALSAMSPAAMVAAVANVRSVLSESGGRAFVRDYAAGDMASARLAGRSTPRRLHAWLPAAAAAAAAAAAGPPASASAGSSAAGEESADTAAGGGGGGGGADDDDARAARAEAAAALLSGGEFLARGDGTRAFYFSEGGLRRLFESAGFETESIGTVHMTKENRATRERMPRKWVQAVFRLGGRSERAGDEGSAGASKPSTRLTRTTATTTATTTSEAASAAGEAGDGERADPSPLNGTRASRYKPEWQESDDDDEEEEEERNGEEEKEANSSSSDEETARAAARLFRTVLVDSTPRQKAAAPGSSGGPNPALVGLETHEVDVGPPLNSVAFSAAPPELRSTLSHTGLLSWPAAPALARILLDPELAASYGSRSSFSSSSSLPLSLLELGAGGSPLVALAAARSRCGFRRVVSTDGSPRALRLLSANLASNARLVVAERLRVRLLPWGDARAAEEAVEAGAVAKAAGADSGRRPPGFAVVVGADTLYSVPALPRLMATVAATLDGGARPSLSSHPLKKPPPPPIAVLCYQERRVRVAAAEAAAREAGLEVVDPAPQAWRAAAERAGVGEGRLLRLLCLRPSEGREMK